MLAINLANTISYSLEWLSVCLFTDLLEIGSEVLDPEIGGLAEFQRHYEYVVHVCVPCRDTCKKEKCVVLSCFIEIEGNKLELNNYINVKAV